MNEKPRFRWFRLGLITTLALLAVATLLVFGQMAEIEAANEPADKDNSLPIALRVTLAAFIILSFAAWYWLFRKLIHGKDTKGSCLTTAGDGRGGDE